VSLRSSRSTPRAAVSSLRRSHSRPARPGPGAPLSRPSLTRPRRARRAWRRGACRAPSGQPQQHLPRPVERVVEPAPLVRVLGDEARTGSAGRGRPGRPR
jgi:hypothetical protein